MESTDFIQEKIINVWPIAKLDYELLLQGIFSLPPEWEKIDLDNPTIFTYTCKVGKVCLKGGKLQPRKLTQKELKEQEQLAAKKKSGKKQAKKQVEVSKQEMERLKKQMLEDEQLQRKFMQEWEKLSQQQKFHRTAEDIYKSVTLKFENNVLTQTIKDNALVALQQRVHYDHGDWIYLFKHVTLTQQQIAKMKKGKCSFGINNVHTIIMRGWLDYSSLIQENVCQTAQRINITQMQSEIPQIPRPNLQKTYLKVKVKISQPFMSSEKLLQAKELIKQKPEIPEEPPQIKCVNELREEIRLALQSIAIEYSNLFSKQLNLAEEAKLISSVMQPKKADVIKRKQQFLYDFNITGKYKILKERLKKSIVKICKNKYADKLNGLNSFTGITTQAKDQFYSQLYFFLTHEAQQTFSKIIAEKREELHQELVQNQQQAIKDFNDKVQKKTGQKREQQLMRQAKQLESLFKLKQAKQKYLEIIQGNPRNHHLKYAYVQFLVKNRLQKFPKKLIPIIQDALSFDSENRDYKYQEILLLMSSRNKNNFQQAWIFLHDLLRQEKDSIQLNLLASLLFEKYLQEPQVSQKFLIYVERIYLRSINEVKQKGQFKENPTENQLPSMNNQVEYGRKLKEQESDQIWFSLLSKLIQKNYSQICEHIIEKLINKDSQRIKMIISKVQLNKNNIEQAINISKQILGRMLSLEKNPNNFTLLSHLGDIYFKNQMLEQAYTLLLKALKSKAGSQNISIFLKVAYIFLWQKQYANAKAFFVKFCKLSSKSALGYKGLGISCLRMNQFDKAKKAFKQSNYFDPYDSEIWGYAIILGLKTNKFSYANQCIREMLRLEKMNKSNITEVMNKEVNKQILQLLKQRVETMAKEGTRCTSNMVLQMFKQFQQLQ